MKTFFEHRQHSASLSAMRPELPLDLCKFLVSMRKPIPKQLIPEPTAIDCQLIHWGNFGKTFIRCLRIC